MTTQPAQYGDFGLGTIITSAIFLIAIVLIAIFMSLRHEGEELVEVYASSKLTAAAQETGLLPQRMRSEASSSLSIIGSASATVPAGIAFGRRPCRFSLLFEDGW